MKALLGSAQPKISPFCVNPVSQDPLRVTGSAVSEASETDRGMFGTLNILPEVPLTFVENSDLASAFNRSRRDKPHISCKLCRLRKVSEPVLALLESPQAFPPLLFVAGLPVAFVLHGLRLSLILTLIRRRRGERGEGGVGWGHRLGPPLTDTVRLRFQVCSLDGTLGLIYSLFPSVPGPM